MKTFLNVLYRRILYKIPLKLLLFLLAVFGILFACFSSADNVEDLIVKLCPSGDSSCLHTITDFNVGTSWKTAFDGLDNQHYYCFKVVSSSNGLNGIDLSVGFSPNYNGTPWNSVYYYATMIGNYECIQGNPYLVIKTSSSSTTITMDIFELNSLLGTALPKYTSLQCQTEYNLIPISSVDSNYCQSNNLCPSCPVCPSVPVGTGGYSQLYINNILHLGAPNIIMNIPDEIDWDYAYTQGGQNMNIDVVGYNVDYEKIDSIVQFQNYKPSSEDFQKIIGLLAPYTKIIVFFVFLFIVWAWIKKPFKSKKL